MSRNLHISGMVITDPTTLKAGRVTVETGHGRETTGDERHEPVDAAGQFTVDIDASFLGGNVDDATFFFPSARRWPARLRLGRDR